MARPPGFYGEFLLGLMTLMLRKEPFLLFLGGDSSALFIKGGAYGYGLDPPSAFASLCNSGALVDVFLLSEVFITLAMLLVGDAWSYCGY